MTFAMFDGKPRPVAGITSSWLLPVLTFTSLQCEPTGLLASSRAFAELPNAVVQSVAKSRGTAPPTGAAMAVSVVEDVTPSQFASIVAVPGDTAVTRPADDTVATAGLLLFHVTR